MTDYPSSTSDYQWNFIKELLTPARLGRPNSHCRRHIFDAISYVLKSGCQWKMLPKTFPPYKTVYHYFRQWSLSGILLVINRTLNQLVRKSYSKNASPSLLITDSQSVQGFHGKQESKGIDGFKKVNGRKRHLIVDTLGLIFGCLVTSANTHDSKVCELNMERCIKNNDLHKLKVIMADKGYRGELEDLMQFRFDIDLQIGSKPKQPFQPKPKRWVVERTNAWLIGSRRLAKDYEIKVLSSENWIILSNIWICLNKLSKIPS